MKAIIKKLFIKSTVKPEGNDNEYTPPLSICDAKRLEFFTTYNIDLANQIRIIKLNGHE